MRNGEAALRAQALDGLRRRVPATAALAVRLIGLTIIVQALLPVSGRHRDDVLGVLSFSGLPLPGTATVGLFFVLLASGLAARKRVAWAGLVALLAIDALLIVPGAALDLADPDSSAVLTMAWWAGHIAVSLFALTAVIAARREFIARTGKRNAWRAVGILGGSFGVAFALGWALITMVGHQHHGGDRTSAMFLLDRVFHTGDTVPAGPPYWIRLVLGLIGAIAVLLATYVWLRPARLDRRLSGHEEQRLRDLLDRAGGQDSLGYFALRRDKATIFSPTGKAAVCYRVLGGVSLAAGDPIGDPEAWPGAISAWLDEARAHAWSPAVLGASERGATAYQRAGLRAWNIGDEAVLEIDQFSLSGRPMRAVRQAVARVRRAGHTVRVRRLGQIPHEELALAARLADGWRDGPVERGYSMALGRLGDPADADYVLVECYAPDGELRGLLGFVPWGADGLSLDLMRRDRDCTDNGLMEFMVAELVAACPDIGVERLSLNFAMFRYVFARGDRIGAGPALRCWLAVLRVASRWWQIESLYRANEKYRPDWVPRFLCYERARDLLRVACAAGAAEGFITVGRRIDAEEQPRELVGAR
jgi:lysyl-tRNA synthetase class 2